MVEEKRSKFCPNCGAEIDINAKICPKCGVEQLIVPKEVSNW
jgi:ribosomal protein L40E